MKPLVPAPRFRKNSKFIPDEGVQGHGLDIVKLLQGVLDLPLVRLGVHNEATAIQTRSHLESQIAAASVLDSDAE